ncbi:MAG: hypothetical protein H0W83_06725 [Planctomycetes bacterium]|nr:hypothetical protein [Planctomycetota bacterium]
MSHLSMKLLRLGSIGVAAASMALFQSCGDNGSPVNQDRGGALPKPPESVRRLDAPSARTQALINELNVLRTEAYFGVPHNVSNSNELYTAAFRHAVYLNTKNSATYNPNPPPTLTGAPGDPGAETLNIRPETDWNQQVSAFQILNGGQAVIHDEDIFPGVGRIYPALYTAKDPMNRVLAVAGGPGLLRSVGASQAELYEDFAFSGNIFRATGSASPYRGYEIGLGTYDELQSIWYSRHGRSFLMDASLRYVAYASAYDDGGNGAYIPPWPILYGRFAGVLMGLGSRPLVQERGIWPNSTSTNVNRFGTDTVNQGPNQYSGVPISISLPSRLPIIRDIGVRGFGGTLSVTFTKSSAVGVPNSWRFLQFYSSTEGLVIPVATGATFTGNEYHGVGGPVPAVTNLPVLLWTWQSTTLTGDRVYIIGLDPSTDFSKIAVGDRITISYPGQPKFPVTYTILAVNAPSRQVTILVPGGGDPFFGISPNPLTTKFDIFSATSTSITALVDKNLADGELVIQPIAPLEPNSTYTVSIGLKTADYPLGAAYDDITMTFTTNGN